VLHKPKVGKNIEDLFAKPQLVSLYENNMFELEK